MTIEIPTQAPKLVEQTYTSVLSAICDGRLQPGERLNQDELAAGMSVPRQPVGQALDPEDAGLVQSGRTWAVTVALRHVGDASLRIAGPTPAGR